MKKLVLTLILICGCIAISGSDCSAKAKKPKIARTTVWLYEDESWTHATDLYSEDDGTLYPEDYISIKSSNEEVLEVAQQDKEHNGFFFNPVKEGQSKITLKYKYKGKTYEESKTVNVKKWSNPIKKTTLNGKNITKSLKKGYYSNMKYKKGSIKINLKPIKGWKIKSITYTYPKYRNVKNNQKLSIPKKQWTRVRYLLKNKQGDEIGINFAFERK